MTKYLEWKNGFMVGYHDDYFPDNHTKKLYTFKDGLLTKVEDVPANEYSLSSNVLNFNNGLLMNFSSGSSGSIVPVTQWWLTDGITNNDLYIVYQPKGAISYENSKINIVNPGVNDAVDVEVQTIWDKDNGWNFGTQTINNHRYFTTENFNWDQDTTIMVRCLYAYLGEDHGGGILVSGYDLNFHYPPYDGYFNISAGFEKDLDSWEVFGVYPTCLGGINEYVNPFLNKALVLNRNGLFCDSGLLQDLSMYPPNLSTFSYNNNFFIGASMDSNGLMIGGFRGTIQAVAIYKKLLTSVQIADIINKMNIL